MTHLSLTDHRGEIILLGLQGFQVLFLWIHDWIPLEMYGLAMGQVNKCWGLYALRGFCRYP